MTCSIGICVAEWQWRVDWIGQEAVVDYWAWWTVVNKSAVILFSRQQWLMLQAVLVDQLRWGHSRLGLVRGDRLWRSRVNRLPAFQQCSIFICQWLARGIIICNKTSCNQFNSLIINNNWQFNNDNNTNYNDDEYDDDEYDVICIAKFARATNTQLHISVKQKCFQYWITLYTVNIPTS